jgi:transcriptional regulator with XRE-family HTH domain
MTQEQVAHDAGLALNYVSELERGLRNPSVATVFRLARALRVGPDQLIRKAANGLE